MEAEAEEDDYSESNIESLPSLAMLENYVNEVDADFERD